MSTNTPVANKWIKQYPFAVVVLSIALVFGYIVITPAPTISRPVAAVPANTTDVERGMEAYAARYQAMAQAYAAKETASSISIQKSRSAEIARLNGIAEIYMTMEAARIQRSWEAYVARYAAMGKQYTSKENIQRGWEAYTARYQAIANQYEAKEAANIQRGWDAYTAQYVAMAVREAKRLRMSATP